MNKNIILLFFLIALISCNRNNKDIIDDDDYNIRVKLNGLNLLSMNQADYYSKIENLSWTTQCIYKYTFNKENFRTPNSNLEIEFARTIHDQVCNSSRPRFCWISMKDIKTKRKAIFICWSNTGPTYEEYQKTNLLKQHYDYEIGKKTDTIATNLSYKKIKFLYPEFSGVYQQIKLDSISLDYAYWSTDLSFYNSIIFYNYDLGLWINGGSKEVIETLGLIKK